MIRQEKARVTKLVTDAENYGKSRLIRDFIAAVEHERINGNQVYTTDQNHETWMKWAKDQADRLDPLVESPPSILDQAAEADDDTIGDDKRTDIFKPW
jgi:hypothetical protein